MENSQDVNPSPKYWMSLEQWRQDPEFAKLAEKEFLSSPLQSEDGKDGWARREFLKVMGASLALTSFGCVRRPAQKIIPYVNKPTEIQHGFPNYYASSFVDGFETLGILVTTRDGRPIKIEGNPDHPANRGGMSARAHAHILKLYDPDRATGPKRNLQNDKRTNRQTINATWEQIDPLVVTQLQKGKVALLSASHMSPSSSALTKDFGNAFGVKNYRYDDVSHQISASGPLPRYRFDKAQYVVAINNDFMGTWLNPTLFQREFMARRKKGGAEMNKLVVFESLMSLTGTNADERHRIRPSQSLDVVMALLNEIIVVRKFSRYASDSGIVRAVSGFAKNGSELGINVSKIAAELIENKGRSLVLAGGLSAGTENAPGLMAAVGFLNAVLDNHGNTVTASSQSLAEGSDIGELLKALDAKQISTLIIHGSNPVYSLPPEARFAERLAGVEMVIYTGDRNDETGLFADILAVDHHSLENWGDLRSLDGSLSIQQPTIEPLHATRAFQDSLLAWMKGAERGSARAKGAETWYDYLRANWRENLAAGRMGGKGFEEFWIDLLQTGVLPGNDRGGSLPVATREIAQLKPQPQSSGFELALYETVGLGNGQLANVSWLQELPDPVTKLVWDNYACFSLRDASQLKIKEGQFVKLTVGERSLEVPAHIQPGQADRVIGLAVGYGRDGGGKVCDGVGVNAFKLAAFTGGMAVTAGLPCKVDVSSKRIPMSGTQGHHTMEGRQLVVEETLADHMKNPGGNVHRHKMFSMWSEHEYKGNKWGMVIDLNTCTGCSACVIACQSENNIPSVGRRYVIDGREMHWLRIDRYYVGSPEDPDVVHQPLPCMHCDNAPCETVCPVIATVHSDEGTNDMIYNRCVGTRYCANNCPYKVRRFNWFDYTDVVAPRHLALNPEVTVRHRGVMEKCSFCIHRVRFHKSQAKVENRPLKTDEVQTACQQSCPTSAIIFGDLNNPESAVAKEFNSPKTYTLLEELNTKPAVRYQVKVRNTEHLKGEKKHHGEAHS